MNNLLWIWTFLTSIFSGEIAVNGFITNSNEFLNKISS